MQYYNVSIVAKSQLPLSPLSEPIHFYLNTDHIQMHMINISWTLYQLPSTANLMYIFGVIKGNTVHYEQNNILKL